MLLSAKKTKKRFICPADKTPLFISDTSKNPTPHKIINKSLEMSSIKSVLL
jgi:hypothetical protein